MDIEVLKQLALGVVPPGFFGLLLFGVLWRSRQAEPTGGRAAAMSLGMGIGFLPLAALIYGGIKFPPPSAAEWIAPIAFVFGLCGAAAALMGVWRATVFVRGAILAFFALASAPSLASASVSGGGAGNALITVVAFIGLALATLNASERLHRRVSGPLPVFLTMALLGAASQVMVLAFSGLKMGQAIGVLASLLGAAWLVSFARKKLSLRSGGLDLPVLAGATAFFQGYMLRPDGVERPMVYVALLAISPWLALLPDVGPAARIKGWKSGALRIVLAMIPLVIALAMGKAANDAAMAGY